MSHADSIIAAAVVAQSHATRCRRRYQFARVHCVRETIETSKIPSRNTKSKISKSRQLYLRVHIVCMYTLTMLVSLYLLLVSVESAMAPGTAASLNAYLCKCTVLFGNASCFAGTHKFFVCFSDVCLCVLGPDRHACSHDARGRLVAYAARLFKTIAEDQPAPRRGPVDSECLYCVMCVLCVPTVPAVLTS